ncbi:MAG TPA: putative sulfate exporter family transporter [Puia sp.]
MDSIKVFTHHTTAQTSVFIITALACLTPWITPPVALLLGLVIAFFVGHPFPQLNHKATNILLQWSVVGLGFGMNAADALRAGRQGILFTVVSITGTLGFGWLLGRLLKIEKGTSFLIAGGTAICGGSAIAALSPVIRAGERQVSVALGTIFILNSIALFLFPFIGHLLHLSQDQFGLWSAIAIHDTSSVVGAAGKYGPEALQIATTVKLARALWIIPVSLLASFFFRPGQPAAPIPDVCAASAADPATQARTRIKIPWFIGFFILVILFNTWLPMPFLDRAIVKTSHAGLTLTLFLIGSGLSLQVLKNTGFRPLLQGILLWALISGATLWAVLIFAHQ